jgi:hypothetical protein
MLATRPPWLRDVLPDEELARKLNKIARRNMGGSELRQALDAVVSDRYAVLESLI